MLSFIS